MIDTINAYEDTKLPPLVGGQLDQAASFTHSLIFYKRMYGVLKEAVQKQQAWHGK